MSAVWAVYCELKYKAQEAENPKKIQVLEETQSRKIQSYNGQISYE